MMMMMMKCALPPPWSFVFRAPCGNLCTRTGGYDDDDEDDEDEDYNDDYDDDDNYGYGAGYDDEYDGYGYDEYGEYGNGDCRQMLLGPTEILDQIVPGNKLAHPIQSPFLTLLAVCGVSIYEV